MIIVIVLVLFVSVCVCYFAGAKFFFSEIFFANPFCDQAWNSDSKFKHEEWKNNFTKTPNDYSNSECQLLKKKTTDIMIICSTFSLRLQPTKRRRQEACARVQKTDRDSGHVANTGKCKRTVTRVYLRVWNVRSRSRSFNRPIRRRRPPSHRAHCPGHRHPARTCGMFPVNFWADLAVFSAPLFVFVVFGCVCSSCIVFVCGKGTCLLFCYRSISCLLQWRTT